MNGPFGVEISKGLPSALRRMAPIGDGAGGAKDYMAARVAANSSGKYAAELHSASKSKYLQNKPKYSGPTSNNPDVQSAIDAMKRNPISPLTRPKLFKPVKTGKKMKKALSNQAGVVQSIGRQSRESSRKIGNNMAFDSWLKNNPNWQ